MLMRALAATTTLWLLTVSMASGAGSIPVLVDARGTYLHTNDSETSPDPDVPAPPAIVDLGAHGLIPGSTMEISFEIAPPGFSYRCPELAGGLAYRTTETFTIQPGIGLLGVFSTSAALDPASNAHRVPGAIDAGTDAATPNTFYPLGGGELTDIPEDFQIFTPTGFGVVIPAGATHLFLGVGDRFVSDNCVWGGFTAAFPRGAINVTINPSAGPTPKGLIEDAITDLGTTQAAIGAALSGVGDPERAIKSLDKAITRLNSSLDAFPVDDPCRLLGEDCDLGTKFFQAVKRAVEAIFEAIDKGGISDIDILADLESIVVGEILEAANIVAAIAIEDATAASGDPSDIAQAEFHFDMAEQQTADGLAAGIEALMFFDDAVESFKQAWENARKAVGDCPPGRRALQETIAELQNVVDADPGTPLADKIEDVISKLDDALAELNKTPPDNEAAVGNIEGAVGDLQAAVDDGLLDGELGEQLMDQLAAIAKQLAVNAINDAIFRGGDPTKIIEAEQALDDGNAERDSKDFKAAVNKYKDALANAEGA